MIYWLYGQPGSGKTTLAKELVYHLDNDLIGNQIRGPYKTVHIDGDGLREIFNNKDYSKEGREKNLRDVNKLIRFLDNQGFSVVVSVVAPYMDIRDEILDLNPTMIYLHTSEIRGKEDYFADEFEIGGEDTHIDTTNKSIQETLKEILSIHRKVATLA